MIRHIMLWNYKDDIPPERRAFLEAELAALPDRVPSLRRVQYGHEPKAGAVGGRNQSFSHCFVMYFDDMAGLAEYTSHPEHINFSAPFKEACAVQVVADFEVQGG
jgi:Stress responsive A/B Barrel Domain